MKDQAQGGTLVVQRQTLVELALATQGTSGTEERSRDQLAFEFRQDSGTKECPYTSLGEY